MTDSVVAVDVGGTTIKATRYAADGTPLAERSVPTPVAAGPGAVVDALRAVARELVVDGVRAVGVVVPGDVDAAGGIARYSANLGWRDVPLRTLVAAEVGVPTVLGHDVKAGALAERELGASHGVPDAVVVAIGTGIAAVAVAGGHPVRGATQLAGELGHLAVVPDGEPCPCGQRGCLERYASASAIARRYAERRGTPADARVVAARLDADPVAAEVWRSATDALAVALAAYTALLDPALFVLAGGLAEAGEVLARPVAHRLAELVRFRPAPPVVVSPLAAAAGRIGAALLAWDAVGGVDLDVWRGVGRPR